MGKLKTEDIYDPENMLMGMAVLLSWTLFLPARLLAYLAKRSSQSATPEESKHE